jgi:hypothetical protein
MALACLHSLLFSRCAAAPLREYLHAASLNLYADEIVEADAGSALSAFFLFRASPLPEGEAASAAAGEGVLWPQTAPVPTRHGVPHIHVGRSLVRC